MDERAKQALHLFMEAAIEAARSAASEEPEPKPSRFPCKTCGGTGIILIRDDPTKPPYGVICPDCLEARNTARWLKGSGISAGEYARYTLDSFNPDSSQNYNMKRLAQSYLAECKEHPNTQHGCGYFGAPGTGKTHICIAICQELHREHHYWQYSQKIKKLKALMYRDADRYRDTIALPCNAPFLYIDDLFKSAVKNGELAQQDDQIMFEIINARYIHRLPTIVSSEYTLSEITEMEEAIGSRLNEMLTPYIYNVEGGNRRLQAGGVSGDGVGR